MSEVKILKQLEQVISSITKGDYSVGKQIEQFIDEKKYSKEVAEFAESLNLMSLKLEAREQALENIIETLKEKNVELSDSIKKREFISSFFSVLLLIITSFIFFANIIQRIPSINIFFFRAIEIVFILFSIFVVKKSKLPLKNFGLQLKGGLKAIKESLVFSAIVIAIMFFLKLLLRDNNVAEFQGDWFIYSFLSFEGIIYLPICFIQEFLARGIAQTSIEFGIEHKHKNIIAVLIASCIFGAIHITTSFEFALISVILSCCWGYLYSRHRTLVGVTVSHYLIGIFAWTLNFWDYLTQI